MELLERIVGKDGRAELVGDLENEGIAAADRAGGRGDDLAGKERLLEHGDVGRIDAIGERRVDDHQHVGAGVLFDERANGFVELGEARAGATFGRHIRAVDHDFVRGHELWVVLFVVDPLHPGPTAVTEGLVES